MNEFRPFRVTSQSCPTEELCRVTLEPTDGGPVFEFKPGQFVMIQKPEGEDPAKKAAFSIASAPHESKKTIELGVKAQGVLSNVLYQAKAGDRFYIQGPFGMFGVDPDAMRTIFIAGGVGVTPFRSMIRQMLNEGNPETDLILFYSGRTEKDLMYHSEFKQLSAEHPSFKYIPICTRECPDGWEGECRRLDAEMLHKHVPDISKNSYLICGPGPMLDETKEVLKSEGVDLKTQLRTERY